jgi:Kef-type K+ transport system membrane component KefB
MEFGQEHAAVLLLTGALLILAILIKVGLAKTAIPALVGYLVLGFLLRLGGSATGLLTEGMTTHLGFLADLGVAALLFRVGLESDLKGLLGQFRNAQGIWIGNVILSGILGYVTSAYLLGFPLIPSLYIAVALTATSVAVPVAVWRDAKSLKTSNGELMLDVAELDDISAVVLMALLFAVVPILQGNSNGPLISTVLETGGWLLFKLLVFGGICYLFSKFAERRLTRIFQRIDPVADSMLVLAGTGSVIAALAGLLGFSIALGAFFAGLVFSHDPEAVTLSRPFVVLYDLFTPFFFISIGLHISPQVGTAVLVPGILLLIAAVVGKLVGTVAPSVRTIGWTGSLLLGVSMVPRAEIAMVVMQHGRSLGEKVMPHEAYAVMVIVSAATCVLAPLFLRPMLNRWPPTAKLDSNSSVDEQRRSP